MRRYWRVLLLHALVLAAYVMAAFIAQNIQIIIAFRPSSDSAAHGTCVCVRQRARLDERDREIAMLREQLRLRTIAFARHEYRSMLPTMHAYALVSVHA